MNEDFDSLFIMENPVSDFLDCYLNKSTSENYRLALSKYLMFVSGGVKLDTVEAMDAAARKYLDAVRGNELMLYHDFRRYGAYLQSTYSPAYASLNFNIVSVWLEDMGVGLSRRRKHRVMQHTSTTRSIRNEVEMTRGGFYKLYRAMDGWCATLLLVLVGSGMRVGETMLIKKSDVDWSGSRPLITLRAETTKTKESRKVYLTQEASEKLKEYLMSRTDSDPRLFPYTKETAEYHMRKAVDRLGYEVGASGLRQLHFHMTRKWFLSQFSLVASRDVAETLTGHKGYLSDSYRRYSRRELLHQFIKAEPYISILGDKRRAFT